MTPQSDERRGGREGLCFTRESGVVSWSIGKNDTRHDTVAAIHPGSSPLTSG
jgi:hypothetical protein